MDGVVVATPKQAILDSLYKATLDDMPTLLVNSVEVGLELNLFTVKDLSAAVLAAKSPALARKAGFVIERASGFRDPNLLSLGQSDRTYSQFGSRNGSPDSHWRIRNSLTPARLRGVRYDQKKTPESYNSTGNCCCFCPTGRNRSRAIFSVIGNRATGHHFGRSA